ncbi:hypothetical protein KFE25_008229 [Diacronema lutheri]|uniref:Dolichyl-phosphate-mannose--protein mannosyltransferase n=1 Tax=Diacronema lutheri TaxID=2081491 RepID=A0A8J6CEF0_DIALT|nr:hypothetical protein KFE25_008229 [Diacronema lutheri]
MEIRLRTVRADARADPAPDASGRAGARVAASAAPDEPHDAASGLRATDCALLLAAALASRCWALRTPRQVVFDEVHFGKFARAYFTGEHYFDIHPPMGKLVLALGAWLGAGIGEPRARALAALRAAPFEHIGEPLAPDVPLLGLRGVAAIASSVLAPLGAALASAVGCSREASALVGWFVVADTALLTEGRLALVDAQLCAACAAQLYCALRARRAARWGAAWLGWLCLCGLSIGFAVGTKWTALSMMAAVGVDSACALGDHVRHAWPSARELRLRGREADGRGPRAAGARLAGALRAALGPLLAEAGARLLLLLALPCAVYAAAFAVHFRLLHAPGEGDGFMSERFIAALRADAAAEPAPRGQLWRLLAAAHGLRGARARARSASAAPMSFWAMLLELNARMLSANRSITRGHSWGSPWYGWPFGLKPILYWTQGVVETAETASARLAALDVRAGSALGGGVELVAASVRALLLAGAGVPPAAGARCMLYLFANPAVWWPTVTGALGFALGTAAGAEWGASSCAGGGAAGARHGSAARADWVGRVGGDLADAEHGDALLLSPARAARGAPSARGARGRPPARLLIAAWALCWLPFAAVSRVQFLYHYFPSLVVTLTMAGLALDRATQPHGAHARRLACGALAAAAAAGCAFWAPLALGLPLTEHGFDRRFWFDAWR